MDEEEIIEKEADRGEEGAEDEEAYLKEVLWNLV